jgi:hypothetical protein
MGFSDFPVLAWMFVAVVSLKPSHLRHLVVSIQPDLPGIRPKIIVEMAPTRSFWFDIQANANTSVVRQPREHPHNS